MKLVRSGEWQLFWNKQDIAQQADDMFSVSVKRMQLQTARIVNGVRRSCMNGCEMCDLFLVRIDISCSK